MRSHTSHVFEAELQALKDRILAMGGRCEQMMKDAIRAFEDRDCERAQRVIDSDIELDEGEREVDELAMRILALRQPVGRDLRFVVAAVKVVTDLERIGDEAVNLAERASEMSVTGLTSPGAKLPDMARRAGVMLQHALNAFVAEDPDKAREVFRQDDAVDELYGETLRSAIDYMKAECAAQPGGDCTPVDDGMRVSTCAKYLERIADHATNIAEMVIFLVEGRDVRHGHFGSIPPTAPTGS